MNSLRQQGNGVARPDHQMAGRFQFRMAGAGTFIFAAEEVVPFLPFDAHDHRPRIAVTMWRVTGALVEKIDIECQFIVIAAVEAIHPILG